MIVLSCALRFLHRAGHGEQLIAVLEFAQRWSATSDLLRGTALADHPVINE